MFRLFRKMKLEAAVAQARRVERQIERIREERDAAEDQLVKEREKREKSLGKTLLQKEKDDLGKADKMLRARPIRGEDPLHDLRELSKLLSHIVGISDDGKHLREKEEMLARAAEAASLIKLNRSGQKDSNDKSRVRQNGPMNQAEEGRQYRAISALLEDLVDDIRRNRSLEMLLDINKAVNAIDRYLSDFGGSEANISEAKYKSQ